MTVIQHGGAMVTSLVRLAAVAFAVVATVALLALLGMASGAPRPKSPAASPTLTAVPIALPNDTKLDHDEDQPGGRHPDADDR